jgi:VIT1/CCC1 family predicted Fe2+/Mn2+ transporter
MSNSTRLRAVSDAPTRKPARAPRTQRELGVVEQVRASMKPKARLATIIGFLFGGFVPLASWVVAHHELDKTRPFYLQVGTLIVLGGLVYSASTVYQWGKLAFRSGSKSLGFVFLLEGVLLASLTEWLSLAALGFLVFVNGIATGCNLSRKAA